MITLDYTTYNNRWGVSGLKYDSWEQFAFALGYLSNNIHYRNMHANGAVELHIENNNVQGAWGKEGRIQYYGSISYLKSTFPDWYNCKSAGVGNITSRINSNNYMYSLVYDFGFEVKTYSGYTTADIFPPSVDAFQYVWGALENHLRHEDWDDSEIEYLYEYYKDGWNE